MSLENKQECSFAIADPIKSDYIFRRGATLPLPPRERLWTAGRACGAREHWWRPLSIRNDFRGWFYPPTFLISATRPPRYRDSGATLRRFELRGEPREYDLTPGSHRRETERRVRGEERGRGERERPEGTDRQEGTRNRARASLFSVFIFYFSKEPYARRMRTPRSPIPNSINMAPLNNGRWIRPAFLERLSHRRYEIIAVALKSATNREE